MLPCNMELRYTQINIHNLLLTTETTLLLLYDCVETGKLLRHERQEK